MRRILVLRGGALGDLIVTFPALARLRELWPNSPIELVGNVTAAELAMAAGLIDAAYSQHDARWIGLFSEEPLSSALREWLTAFDLVVNYWPDPDGSIRSHFPLREGQIFLHAAAHPQESPAAMHYCRPLRARGFSPERLWFDLGAALESRGKARAIAGEPTRTKRGIAIHPGSGSLRKNWPLPRWAELCAWLHRERGESLLIITGDAESAGLLAQFGTPARQLPLLELCRALRGCRFFLGHDSGISHLAAALGVPSLLLFGPTDPAMWSPPATHVHTLRRGLDLAAISVSEVQAAVTTRLADQT